MPETINAPDLWAAKLPKPHQDGHKYDRGHAVIIGADTYTGATRLAAEACSRIGAGLVTVQSLSQAQTYRTTLPADIMVRSDAIAALNRPSTVLAGPGGCNDVQAETLMALPDAVTLVLDADAIRLWPQLKGRTGIVTPHAGEFERYFDVSASATGPQAAEAAKACGMILVLKGPETVIAAPDGRAVTNQTASPYLAKAGTGDVLAGLIAGLLAQGMPAFEAACAAAWIHGHAGERIGPGLVPQDIISELSAILRDLLA